MKMKISKCHADTETEYHSYFYAQVACTANNFNGEPNMYPTDIGMNKVNHFHVLLLTLIPLRFPKIRSEMYIRGMRSSFCISDFGFNRKDIGIYSGRN